MSNTSQLPTKTIQQLLLDIPSGSIIKLKIDGVAMTIRIAAVLINHENGRVRIQPSVRLICTP